MNGASDRVHVGIRITPAGSLPANMVPHPREEKFSVLVVNDHPPLREATAARLTQMGAGAVHEAASVAEARARALATGPCDLAILDLGLPDGSGIDLVTELRAQGWPRIVVLASSDDPNAVRSAFQAGAMAYLLKSASPMVVTDAVRRVLDGGVYADPGVAPVLAAGTQVQVTKTGTAELSVREVEVLQLVADGHSNKGIGDVLNLSAPMVSAHLLRIGRKFGTDDPAQMVELAKQPGVITETVSPTSTAEISSLLARSSLGQPSVVGLSSRASDVMVDKVVSQASELDNSSVKIPFGYTRAVELSVRELEVLQRIAEGQSNKEIGKALNLSALTVKSHLSRIGRKLGTGDRAEMVALAMRAGVIR